MDGYTSATVVNIVEDEVSVLNGSEGLCRLCANTDNQLIPIFTGDGLEHNIHHKIEKYLPIVTVSESDKLPSQICYQCASTLISWHSLYEASAVADKRLRELFNVNEDHTLSIFEDCKNDPQLIEFTPVSSTDIDESMNKNGREKRYIARDTRKWDPLAAEIGSSTIDEDRAKKVKHGKTAPKSSAKCEIVISSAGRCTQSARKKTITNDTPPSKPAKKSDAKPSRPIAARDEIEMQVLLNPDSSLLPSTIHKGEKEHSSSINHLRISFESTGIENVVCNFFTCHYCGMQFKMKNSVKRHIVGQHLNQAQPKRKVPASIICSLCNRTFKRNYSLRRHVDEVHEKKSSDTMITAYCCDFCGQAFENSPKMLAHRAVVHAATDPLSWTDFRKSHNKVKPCDRCAKYFKDGDFLRQHSCKTRDEDDEEERCIEAQMKSPPVYRCDKCSVCFMWKPLYRQHREDSHPDAAPLDWSLLAKVDITNYCETCLSAFDNDEQPHYHECIDYNQVIAAKGHPCPICRKDFSTKANLLNHVRRMHKDAAVKSEDECHTMPFFEKPKVTFQCPYCPSALVTRNNMRSHVQTVHNIFADTLFVCVPCDRVFKNRRTLMTHNQMYHPEQETPEETNKMLDKAEILLDGEQAWHCNYCKRNFLDKLRFLAHYRLHLVERKFTCDLCGMRTRTLNHLTSHIKCAHLNIRNYQCDICNKKFYCRLTCDIHRRTHTGERPFSCELCGKTFISTSAVMMHKKFHNDFYPHACHVCPKKFKVRTSLVNHIRTHTGERPFKCDICPKTFNSSSRFSYHKKVTHSENRPFVCTICNTRYKANKFLMKHTKRAHTYSSEGGNDPNLSRPSRKNVKREASKKTVGKVELLEEFDKSNVAVDESSVAVDESSVAVLHIEESYEIEMPEQ